MGGGIPWGETVGLIVRSEFSRHLLSFCSHIACEQVLSHSQIQLTWVLRFLDGLVSLGVAELGLRLGSRWGHSFCPIAQVHNAVSTR